MSQWLPGIVVERIHERQYGIVSEKGRKISRNRQDIKMNPNEVKVQFTLPKVPLGSHPIAPRIPPVPPHKTFPKSSNSSKDNNRHTQGHQPSSSFQSTKYPHQPNKSSSLQDSTSSLMDCKSTPPVSGKLNPSPVKGAALQGKLAISTDHGSSNKHTSTRSGRTVRKPARFRDF